jgi:hypothetical protein
MNNTKSLTAIAAILIATTLVVGAGTFAATSASAYQQKKGGGQQENSKNGNTVTIEECKQRGSVSGFDNTLGQECQNVICTHPGSGATCVSDLGKVTPPTPTPKPTTGTLVVKKLVECKEDMVKSIIHKCPKPEDFAITVTGNGPDPASFDGSESGTPVKLGVGHYEVSEDEHEGFTADFSPDCKGTIAAGDQKTCTITNTEKDKDWSSNY